jgi:hypothetical protein
MNRRPKFVRRDVFPLLSDGIIEIEDSLGSEFGLERVELLPAEYGLQSLENIEQAHV